MSDSTDNIPIYDLKPDMGSFEQDVLAGLSRPQPHISPKYFYDDRGSLLFDRICRTPEYYLTRTELAMLPQVAADVASLIDPDCAVIELGVGMSEKALSLLAALPSPSLYAGADINRMALTCSLNQLRPHYPSLRLAGIVADFTNLRQLPPSLASAGDRRLCFLPGSTIGNFPPDECLALLQAIRSLVGDSGALLIGADLQKDIATLESAYNDAEGVTASFNLNLLHRMQTELDAKVNPDDFSHLAFYNKELQRMEMHLIAGKALTIEVAGTAFCFDKGDGIHTENSYKFSPESFAEIAQNAGFTNCRHWTDPKNLFGVFWLTA